MAFEISYSRENDVPRAKVWLDCDNCRHMGTAKYTWQVNSKFWWLDHIENGESGRPPFESRPQQERANIYHCDRVVFEAKILSDPSLNSRFPYRDAANAITLLRKATGMSEAELSRKSGVDRHLLRAIERGEIAITKDIMVDIKAAFQKKRAISEASLSVLDQLVKPLYAEDYTYRTWVQLGEVLGRIKRIEDTVDEIARKLQAK